MSIRHISHDTSINHMDDDYSKLLDYLFDVKTKIDELYHSLSKEKRSKNNSLINNQKVEEFVTLNNIRFPDEANHITLSSNQDIITEDSSINNKRINQTAKEINISPQLSNLDNQALTNPNSYIFNDKDVFQQGFSNYQNNISFYSNWTNPNFEKLTIFNCQQNDNNSNSFYVNNTLKIDPIACNFETLRSDQVCKSNMEEEVFNYLNTCKKNRNEEINLHEKEKVRRDNKKGLINNPSLTLRKQKDPRIL